MMLSRVSAEPPGSRAPSNVGVERRASGVAIVTLDVPGADDNTMTPSLLRELGAALDALFADDGVRALVIRGKPTSFVAGASVEHLRSVRFAQDAEAEARERAERFGAIANGPKPVVALVDGAALGVGFELSLACSATVATAHARTVFGFPEVKHGLVPAGNGLLRVAERAGLRVALELGLTGRTIRATEALALGLVDDVVDEAIGLSTAAALAEQLAKHPTLARSLTKKRAPRSPAKLLGRALVEKNALGRAALFRKARREVQERTHGHEPAAERLVDLLARFGAKGFRAAAAMEPHMFGELVMSEPARRLLEVSLARSALETDSGLLPGELAAPQPVEHIGVVGAGLMGAGIAYVSARAGLSVRMKDTDDVTVGRGLRYVKDVLEEQARRGGMPARERGAVLARVSGGSEYAGFRKADLVIEAVFERLELKQAVLRDIERLVRDSCVIASNTNAIPIARLAEACSHPERIVGMHYGSPVHKTRLLEVVRAPSTDPRAVATAVAVGKRQGKAVIVVEDGPAFYTTRVLVPYLNEAMFVLAEGSSIDAVDGAMRAWGFPIGPFQLLDLVGIDLGAHVFDIAHGSFGERIRPHAAVAALRADGRKGRKNARGFYLHGRHAPKRPTVDETVYPVMSVAPRTKAVSAEEISSRCALAMINEALRARGEGVIRSARDGDLGAILGVGFPAFRGGPFRHVDVLGAPEILRRMRSLEQRFGERFEPAPLLVDMARSGKRFYD